MGETALRQRIEQLEEQLVDMQVVVGTLNRSPRSASAGERTSAGRGNAGPPQPSMPPMRAPR
jgi:hypothetical protein